MKHHFANVTLVVIDTTPKVCLAYRAISKCLEQATFGAVKLLTHDASLPHAVKIPPINTLSEYSDFCIKELHKHVHTSHAMVAQWDGYLLRAAAWTDDFLAYDYIGSPWLPANIIGNGGWSLRSKKFLKACAQIASHCHDSTHPEDAYVSMRHRADLESLGCRFAPIELAQRWGFEGRSFDSAEWRGLPTAWNGQCGFHSWLTKMPAGIDRPKICHSSGDAGDTIYGCAVIKALGGGVLFLSPHNHYPYPLNSRWARMGGTPYWVDNLKPLLEEQPYIWRAQYTHRTPFSTDVDLNKFREPWKNRTTHDFDSILSLNCRAFGLPMPTSPWLTVNNPVTIPGRPIVVSRSERYLDHSFPWGAFCQKWGDRMVFVGTEKEAGIFRGFGAPKHSIPHYPTKDCLELAKVIAGAKVFVGNQSLPLAIAHGLGKTVICEEWKLNANCHIEREGAYYGMPEDLLT